MKKQFFGGILSIVFIISGVSFYILFRKKEPTYTDAEYIQQAISFSKVGNVAGAIQCYEQAIEVNPNNVQACFSLAFEQYKNKNYDKTEHFLRRAAMLAPNNYFINYMLAQILSGGASQTLVGVGKIEESIDCYKRAIALNPHFIEAHRGLGFSYLMVGEFQKGWDEHDLADQLSIKEGKEKLIPKLWDGSNLKDKIVFIRDQGGFGDMFCWIRYAKLFKQQGATVAVEARPALIPILSRCNYIDLLIKRGDPWPSYDFIVPIGRLAQISRTDFQHVPAPIPYLHADAALVEAHKQKLSSDKNFKIGICWDPQVFYGMRNRRAVPLSCFYALKNIPHVSLYRLQRVNGVEQLSSVPKDFVVHTFDDSFDRIHGSFMDTAAVMKQLDLIITADTSVAHLAGALGVQTWVMLPKVADWRWLLNRSDCLWYPTMKLFRQQKLNDWKSVMNEVVSELEKIV